MTKITINERRRELVITKKFDKAASRFGSPEYLELREARREFPSFKVVVRANNKNKKDTYKGLTFEYMEKYIKAHDDEKNTIMTEFRVLRAQTEDGEEALAVSCSYQEIKVWFFGKYPQIAEFHKKREEILKSVA